MPLKPGRKPLNSETPLSPSEVRYVEAIRRGLSKNAAFRAAGFPFRNNISQQAIAKKIFNVENKPNVALQLDQARQAAAEEAGGSPVELLPLPEVVDLNYLNTQATFLLQDAHRNGDTDASLKVLTFIARLNGLIGMGNGAAGRPKTIATPNMRDTQGNHGTDTNKKVSSQSPGEDSFFSDLDDGDGGFDQEGDEPFYRTLTERESSEPGTSSDEPGAVVKRGTRSSGENGNRVSGEASGE